MSKVNSRLKQHNASEHHNHFERPLCIPWVSSPTPTSLAPSCARHPVHLRVDVHLRSSRAMPSREKHTTPPALMLHILEGVHNVGNASQARETAANDSPQVCSVSRFECDVGHGPLPACRAIRWRRSASQARNRCHILVNGAALLLGRHARLLHRHAGLLLGGVVGLDVCALGMLGLGRAGVLRIHWLLLLLVLRIRVLVVDGWLARYVGRLGKLLHGNYEVISKKSL
jgi:hypothetical protein